MCVKLGKILFKVSKSGRKIWFFKARTHMIKNKQTNTFSDVKFEKHGMSSSVCYK